MAAGMSDAGAFNDRARAAILEAGQGRCVGCGRPDVTTQHRRARGMGGTSDVSIGHPANGVPLCGDGVRGCHGWTEANPTLAALLGWRLERGELALAAPFYTRHGWRRWDEEDVALYEASRRDPVARIPYVGTAYVDEDEDLDRLDQRLTAVTAYRRARLPARTAAHD